MRRMKSPFGRFTSFLFSNFIKVKDINKTSAGVLPIGVFTYIDLGSIMRRQDLQSEMLSDIMPI